MKKLLLFFSLSVSALTLTFAQDFTYSNLGITSVSFSGGNLTIRRDNTGTSYTAPQWTTAAVKSPVAYVSGVAPRCAAVFTINCANVPDSVYIRGNASDAITFAATKVQVAPGGGPVHNINYPATTGSHVFTAGIVRFFKPFAINWEISFDNGVTYKPIGTTNNTLYVTKSAPMAETSQFRWWHTVYDLSCRNAQGETLDTAIISHIWTEFTDQVVLNYNDDSLFYYKAMNSPNVNLASLLQFRDAECYTFAQLFLAAIKVQGIVKTNNYVFITPINNVVCGYAINRFLVKNWVFGTPTAAGTCPQLPWHNTYTTLIPSPYTAYNFVTADVTDAIGIPGSCNPNPSSFFNNHQIVKLNGVYYDACYGVTFPSLAAVKWAAFDGFGYRITGSTTNCYFTNDLNISDLSETITTW